MGMLPGESSRRLRARRPGTVLNDRFVIDAVLGQGGQGIVYVAHHTVLQGHRVAIKEMIATGSNPERVARAVTQFRQEAQMLFALQHAGLVKVHDYFAIGDSQFLVMDLVDGASLAEYVREPPDSLGEHDVMPWVHQICDVLEYLHTQSPPIVFRDLKPGNIMVDKDGHVRLIDFGIARILAVDAPPETYLKGAGSLGFCPPEQHLGRADPRSDIYALGATMYVLLTGTLLPISVVRTVEDTVELPSSLNPSVSPVIELAMLHMLRLDPGERPQTIDDVRQELLGKRAVPKRKHVTAAPAPPTRSVAWPLLAGAILSASVLGIGTWWALHARPVQMTIHSTPEGAELVINGQPRGRTPYGLSVPEGKLVHVDASLPGYQTVSVTMEPVASPPAIELTAQPHQIDVHGSPPAQLTIDGTLIGACGPNEQKFVIAHGVHRVDIKAPHYQSYHTSVSVPVALSADVPSIAYTLTPDPATMKVSGPPGATVTVNGIRYTHLPLQLSKLAPGPYRIQATAPGYTASTQEVTLGPGDQRDVVCTLTAVAGIAPVPTAPPTVEVHANPVVVPPTPAPTRVAMLIPPLRPSPVPAATPVPERIPTPEPLPPVAVQGFVPGVSIGWMVLNAEAPPLLQQLSMSLRKSLEHGIDVYATDDASVVLGVRDNRIVSISVGGPSLHQHAPDSTFPLGCEEDKIFAMFGSQAPTTQGDMLLYRYRRRGVQFAIRDHKLRSIMVFKADP